MEPIRPPVTYRDTRVAGVVYATQLERIVPFIEGTGLTAVNVAGRALVNATWFDYGTSSIGPYREFSIGIIATIGRIDLEGVAQLIRGKAGRIGSYVLALPVDSEVARIGGVQIYGLPKTTMEFALKWSSSALSARIGGEGAPEVLAMEIPLWPGLPRPIKELLVYSRLGTKRLATSISTDWNARVDLVARPRMNVKHGEHPLAKLVTDLGLDHARIVATVHGTMGWAELPAPTSW